MAKKKKSRAHRTSAGIVGTNRKITNALRRERSHVEDTLNRVKAWKELKNPWVTIANPSKAETAKKFIKVKANDLWGDPKKSFYMMGASNKEESDG